MAHPIPFRTRKLSTPTFRTVLPSGGSCDSLSTLFFITIHIKKSSLYCLLVKPQKSTIVLTILAALILLTPRIAQLYGDYLWFDTQALASVYFTTLTYQITIFAAVAITTYLALHLTIKTTEKNIRKHTKEYTRSPLLIPIAALTSLFTASTYATQWDAVLRYVNSFSFQTTDPIFNKNIAFYIYELPFYELLTSYVTLLTTLALTTALVLYALYYKQKEIPDVDEDIVQSPPQQPGFSLEYYSRKIKEHAYTQLLILGALVLATSATSYYLARYDLLYSTAGTVYGIGFTEATIRIPALWILTIASAAGAAALLINTKKQNDKVVLAVIITIITLSLLTTAAAAITQNFIVEPDELNKEQEYIAHEIQHTREAFALDRVTREDRNVQRELTREQLQQNQPTIDNARLWDDRPLQQTLNEIQIFRSYYRFPNIDVDRYTLEGERRLMMLSPREIDIRALEQRSRTWVNRHLVYTHGFGAVMAPASEVASGNLPQLLIQDIPPQSSTDINITQPRIYYGELTTDYAIVNTNTLEHDYPDGDENRRIHYPGEGGVQLDNTLKQLTYAIQFRAPQILFSDSIHQESRIQYNRQISQRAQKLAPFLQLDNDPYLVIADNGELYWIQDAYTTSNKYPYSNPVQFHGQQKNYIRNSAKAIINAYTGETHFYIAEPNDPLINSYQQAYPELFRNLDELPHNLQEHIRYPQDLFSAQAHRYQDYHMQEPNTFYNREDSWRIPNEVVRGIEQPLRPYYQVMQLPGYQEAEYIQVQPFIPRGRENLIGWLAARSDQPNYGDLRAYHFSRQELTYGPMQIESRIDQDTDISQQITLWSSAGTSVVRGNLLVIPIQDTILYIEPLFLEAREQGALPQLMRVIAVHEDRIAMAPTLEAALQAITDPTITTPIVDDPQTPIVTDPGQIQEIRDAYRRAQEALDRGDLRAYADRLEELEELLE